MSRSHVAAFAIVLTGPPGAGKTSVLTALVDALSDDNVPHAAVDVEALVWAHPALDHEQRLRHVQTVCRLYREVGYRLLLLADTIETDADLAALLDAVGAKQHVVVRLEAALATLAKRIVEREPEEWSGVAGLVEHAERLATSMPSLRDVTLVVSTEGKRPEAVAERIRAVWPAVWPELLAAPGRSPR
jgi:GTPase SAR1 family protein